MAPSFGAGLVTTGGVGDADAQGLGAPSGAADGETQGVTVTVGVTVASGDGDGVGVGDGLALAETDVAGADGDGEGADDTAGARVALAEGVIGPAMEGEAEPGRPGFPVPIPSVSTTTAPPFSQGSGLVNWPSEITSKWRWQPVEKPVVPTRPRPWCVCTFWPTCTPMAERWL